MYWFFFILGGIILVIFLFRRSVKDVRTERRNNLPITDISILQNRFQNQITEYTIFSAAKMTVMALISQNGGAMSWFPYGEYDKSIGVPNEIKEYINNINNSNFPDYIVALTFTAYTESGPYLMVDFFSTRFNTTFSIGFLNQKSGYDLMNNNLADLFLENIKKELEELK